MYAITGEGFAQ